MKLLDRLVVKEIVGPWLFGVGLFSALIMAATYLNTLATYLSEQIPGDIILRLTILFIPAIVVRTFTMAMLLASLLAFGRLSADSEIVAMRASGASIVRIVRPVMVFSLVIAVVTFAFNELVVPGAADEAAKLKTRVMREMRPEASLPVSQQIIEGGKLRGFINASNVLPATQTLQGVTLVFFDDKEQPLFVMQANALVFKNVDDWRVQGGATIVYPDLAHMQSVVKVNDEIWPTRLPKLSSTFDEITGGTLSEFDTLSMAQLRKTIDRAKSRGKMKRKQIRNYEYGYYNKIALPLAAIVFGTLGAVLGIRSHRTGTAAGFALALAIIFGYLTMVNFLNVWAQGGVIPPYAASFAPLIVGALATLIIMWKRNG